MNQFETSEELLFSFRTGRRWANVCLITYENGTQDLHIPTAHIADHANALEDARILLATRGLKITARSNFLWPSGTYYNVEPK